MITNFKNTISRLGYVSNPGLQLYALALFPAELPSFGGYYWIGVIYKDWKNNSENYLIMIYW